MENSPITGSGKNYFNGLTPEKYREVISTPSALESYFVKFHEPLIEEAKRRFGSPITLLDIACGPADELEFFKNDSKVKIIATDISQDITPYVKQRNPDAGVFVSDANLSAIKENSMDAGIMVNALAYSPDKMLQAMHDALKPGAQCVVNFSCIRINLPPDAYFMDDHGSVIANEATSLNTKGGNFSLEVSVIDHKDHVDRDMRPLGKQIFFKSLQDAVKLCEMVGFKIVSHSDFDFTLGQKVFPTRSIVLTLEKPTGTN